MALCNLILDLLKASGEEENHTSLTDDQKEQIDELRLPDNQSMWNDML